MTNPTKQRLTGIDVARAVAIFGMIIVNFKIVLGAEGANWLVALAGIFDGKASATFVVLAGMGLAFSTRKALENKHSQALQATKVKIFKRALFLFVVGCSYIPIWPADILHFYGIYMLITLLFIGANNRTVLVAAVACIFIYPALMLFWNYEAGWNFETLHYHGFWTPNGFARNLFFNGFHPVIPWTAFMLFGYWLGRQNLHNTNYVKRTFFISSGLFLAIQLLSFVLIGLLAGGDTKAAEELQLILGTGPMPPLPLYMLNGIAIATATIAACLLIASRFEHATITQAFNKTGQLSLSFYVAHVIIGMGLMELIDAAGMGNYPLEFSVLYALAFSVACVVFAWFWTQRFKQGPLEYVMRKVTG